VSSEYSLNEISNEVQLHPSDASRIQPFQCACSMKECFLPSLSYQFRCFAYFQKEL